MPTINQLPLRSPVSPGDQIPIYSPNNGDARRTPISAVADLIVNGLDLPNTAVLLTGDQTVGGTKTFSNAIVGSITGNAGTVTNGVYTTGDQTIGGTKTFSSAIVGDITGNAGTVTNGVYTTGDQTIGGTKTFSNAIVGDITGNAGTVTNGVYTTGNQTIGGTKTFSSAIVGDITGNAATATTATTATTASSVTNGVYTVGDQTIGGTKTFSVNPILSAGTVNAILTLDGSKQISAVSGLTWDGTKSNLSLNGVTVGQGNVPSLNNIAFGTDVLTTATSGQSNVAIGTNALRLLTTGNNNIAIGINALRANTTGSSNTAIGISALFTNQTGSQNVAVGNSALQNSTVSGNVAVGVVALAYNTTGTLNTAVGTGALNLEATGSSNTAVGYYALKDFRGGSSNTALGYEALIGAFPNSNSSSNTAVGASAGRGITTGGSNTLVGESAGSSLGVASNNTLVGRSAGSTIITGDSNTVLGRFDGNQNSLDIRTTSNNIVLSDGAGNPRSYYDGPNNAWIWRTGASERLRLDSSGNVAFSAGTAAAPALTTIGDTDTGVFFPAANTWAVATDASERMRITSSGRVGIGTTPSTTLDVQGDITARGASISSAAYINMGAAYTAAYFEWVPGSSQLTINNSQAGPLRFATNNGERMRIDSAGLVGIGTASPAVRLDIAEADSTQLRVRATTNGVDNRISAFGLTANAGVVGTYSNHPLAVFTNGQERMRIDTSGRVQIGLTSGIVVAGATAGLQTATTAGFIDSLRFSADSFAPVLKLVKSRSATVGANVAVQSSDSLGQIGFVGADGTSYLFGAAISGEVDGTPGTNDMPGRLVFSTTADGFASPTERMRITSAGNVGIGTNNPLQPLDVVGIVRATGTGSSFALLQGGNADGAGIRLCRAGSASQNAFITQFQGSLFIKNVDSGAIIFTTTTSDTERMRIKSAGQVRFVPLAADPAGAESGDVYYNSGTNKLRVYNGTTWVDLH